MKIARAPLRISYLGGGTDFPAFYKKNPGACVVAAAINSYVYVYHHPLSELARENIRFTYRETESVLLLDELKHPLVREMLKCVDWNKKSNFGTFADLPSGAGLGGSSAFSVALAILLSAVKENRTSQRDAADLAVRVEREILGEPGGVQDQFVSAFGGLRSYHFSHEKIEVSENLMSPNAQQYLEERQILMWLGVSRESALYATQTQYAGTRGSKSLQQTVDLVSDVLIQLHNLELPEQVFDCLMNAMKRGWELKKEFTASPAPEVSFVESVVSQYHDVAMKLCGAGGTGFVLILGNPSSLNEIQQRLSKFPVIRPKFDLEGAKALL